METHDLEYKSSWHDDYLKWICGFANAKGGTMLVGKNDNGEIVGVSEHLRLMETLPNKIRESMGIVVDVDLVNSLDLYYIEIKVPPFTVPISLRGRYYKRSGNTNMELTGPALTDFLQKKSGKTWDGVVEERFSLGDIDQSAVESFFKIAGSNGRLSEALVNTSLEDFLVNLRLIESKGLNRAAILLFGKDPRSWFVNAFAKIGRFGRDETDLLFQDVVEGDILSMPGRILELLETKYLVYEVKFDGLLRSEKTVIPVTSIREILLNAIVHREFVTAPVQIKVFSDRLEIWNPGLLPTGMSIEDLERSHVSRPQNPIIADVFFKAGFIESWGRGTLKVIQDFAEAGLPKPHFEINSGGIRVTLYVDRYSPSSLQLLGLNDRQIKTIEYLKTNSSISNKEFREIFKVSNVTAFRELGSLVDNKILVASGKGRNISYSLL